MLTCRLLFVAWVVIWGVGLTGASLLASEPAGGPVEAAAAEAGGATVAEMIDARFGVIVGYMAAVLFWEPVKTVPIPLIVLILLCGSVFFTVYFGFLNIRGFKHAIDITRGRYDNPDDPGEISHFQALTSALSATVGLGNIAGVAVAIQLGGPGAVIWMIVIGLFGMTAKFNECTLAQVYRKVHPDGTVDGGPMHYLEIGLQQKGFPFLVAKLFGLVFAVFCIGGSFGGGNMFQANQATSAIRGMIGDAARLDWLIGCVLAFFVGLVIIGGIRRIGQVTEKIIPLMCSIYVLAGLVILVVHARQIPAAAVLIVQSCVAPEAIFGGFVGVMVQGIKRAVFSNEAGVGSAAIAHAAAKTDEPVREGMVAMLGPFIDTVVICTMTALVLVISGASDQRAAIQTVVAPFNLQNLSSLTITQSTKNGNTRCQVAIQQADFEDITEATADELSAVIARVSAEENAGIRVAVTKAGGVYLWSSENLRIEIEETAAVERLGMTSRSASGNGTGVEMTRWAFADTLSWFPVVLNISVLLFAYSTMISWSYYGEKAWQYLFGSSRQAVIIYRSIFLGFIVLGAISSLENVISFSDLMILSMAFPNVIGGVILAPKVKALLADYWTRYRNNEFVTYD